MAPTHGEKPNPSKGTAQDITRAREGRIDRKTASSRPNKPSAAAANIRNYMADAQSSADAGLNAGSLVGLLQGTAGGDKSSVLALAAAKMRKGKVQPKGEKVGAAKAEIDTGSLRGVEDLSVEEVAQERMGVDSDAAASENRPKVPSSLVQSLGATDGMDPEVVSERDGARFGKVESLFKEDV